MGRVPLLTQPKGKTKTMNKKTMTKKQRAEILVRAAADLKAIVSEPDAFGIYRPHDVERACEYISMKAKEMTAEAAAKSAPRKKSRCEVEAELKAKGGGKAA